MEKDIKKGIIEKAKILEKDLGRRVVKRDSSYIYSMSRKYFGSWKSFLYELGHSIDERRVAKIPLGYSKDLLYFMGLLCSDGHIQIIKKRGHYKIIIFTSFREERDLVKKIIKKLFNYDASIREKNYGFSKKTNYEIYLYSKSLCNFFVNQGIPSGNKSSNILFPKVIGELPLSLKVSFIRGLFDGDGSIFFSNQRLFLGYILDLESLP